MKNEAIPIEMYLSVMAGFVLAFLLMVGEIVALRKQAPRIFVHLRLMYQSGKKARFFVSIFGITVFFLIQPVIVAVLVVLALNNLSPYFYQNLMHELKQGLGDINWLSFLPVQDYHFLSAAQDRLSPE